MSLKSGVLAVVLMLFAVSSQAASEAKGPVWETYTFQSGEGALSISDLPCTVPNAMEEWSRIRTIVRMQHGIDIGEPKQSRLLWQGKVYAGCYIVSPDTERVYNIDSLGEKLMPTIPRGEFVPHEGALPAGGQKTR